MALGTIETKSTLRKIYLTISKGVVERSLDNGRKEQYSYVEGAVERIHQKERTFGSEKMIYWYIDIRDTEGELYSIGFPFNAGTFKSIVLSLAGDESLSSSSIIRIEPYQKGGYTKVRVWADGVKLDWKVKELPPVETVEVGGKKVKDETKRMELISELAQEINDKVGASPIPEKK